MTFKNTWKWSAPVGVLTRLDSKLNFEPNKLPQTPVISKNGKLTDRFLGLALGATSIRRSTYRNRGSNENRELVATSHFILA